MQSFLTLDERNLLEFNDGSDGVVRHNTSDEVEVSYVERTVRSCSQVSRCQQPLIYRVTFTVGAVHFALTPVAHQRPQHPRSLLQVDVATIALLQDTWGTKNIGCFYFRREPATQH